jgi:hypothetical protein
MCMALLSGRALLVICLYHAGVDSARFRCRVFWEVAFILSFIGCDFGRANSWNGGLDGQDCRGPQIWETKLLLRTQHLMRRMKRGCIAWIWPFVWILGRVDTRRFKRTDVFSSNATLSPFTSSHMFGRARLPTRIYEDQYFKQNKKKYTI